MMDAQLRKERRECDLFVTRINVGVYNFVLDHESETAIWRIWKSHTSGRWIGTNDEDGRMIDAPSLSSAKLDLRLGHFV